MEADRCVMCGDADQLVLEKHHLKPKKQGGDESPENIMILCANCHKLVQANFGGNTLLFPEPEYLQTRRHLRKKYIEELKRIWAYQYLQLSITDIEIQQLEKGESPNED